MKVLMVCLGNICRSPLAEGILKSKSKNIIVDSAGTAGYHIGNKPDIRSIEIARKYNLDISDQRARQFNTNDFNIYDKIYAMDNDNYSKIISLAENQKEIDKVDLILNESYPNQYKSVPDPYYGGEKGFENIFHLLNNACEKIIERHEKR
ncbi:MAG: low molecular weight phosphotyrosine protein phosphatase [Flavobacteriales bacterium]|nr:low molecular weight phosphotyrosine protein phosphatase [Flavobacteriales bacterium]